MKGDRNVYRILTERKVVAKSLVQALLAHSLDKPAVEFLHIRAGSYFGKEVAPHRILFPYIRDPLFEQVVLEDLT
jgi:hypothetical protein